MMRPHSDVYPSLFPRAGDGFYESPHHTHLVSANANVDAPAHFIAFSICDRNVELSGPPASDDTEHWVASGRKRP